LERAKEVHKSKRDTATERRKKEATRIQGVSTTTTHHCYYYYYYYCCCYYHGEGKTRI